MWVFFFFNKTDLDYNIELRIEEQCKMHVSEIKRYILLKEN